MDSDGTYFYELDGPGVRLEFLTLRADDYYFFIDDPFMYRYVSISEYKDEEVGPIPEGRGFQSWLIRLVERLPGIEVEPLIVDAERLLPLFTYEVRLAGTGSPSIVLAAPGN